MILFSGADMISFRGDTLVGRLHGGQGRSPRTPENFLKFSKDFLRKLIKCNILADFLKDLTNYALNSGGFGQKTQIVGKF